MSEPSRQEASRRVMLAMMSLSSLYAFMYCMMACNAFGLLSVFGGALYLCGRVAATLAQIFAGEQKKYLVGKVRALVVSILCGMLLCSLLLLAVYPGQPDEKGVWILFAMVLTLTMRGVLARRLALLRRTGRISVCRMRWLYAALHVLPLAAVGALLLLALPIDPAWQTLLGFALSSVMESYSLWREQDGLMLEADDPDVDEAAVRLMSGELHAVNAYTAYQRMHLLILMALQVTLVMVYTFIGLTTEELLWCMGISVLCTLSMRELTDFVLAHLKRRKPATLQMLLVGLFLWMYGLALFYRELGAKTSLVLMYLNLALCCSGMSIVVTCLASVEQQMTDVAEFSLNNHMSGYAKMRAISTEMAILLGQMVGLALLTVLSFSSDTAPNAMPADLTAAVARFKPLVVVPALLLLVAATISVLNFPMNTRHFDKLDRYLTEETDNPALKKQLDSVVVKRHKNRFGVKIIIALLRPLYYHKVVGKENLAGYEDGTMLLVCNHGELYGPVVTNLYIPISFRPWVMSNMMEPDVVVQYVYDNTVSRQKWIPGCLKKPLTKLICPLFLWIFRSIEAIPVYRGQPRELLKTFRMTVEAMQAGDNILIFPENAEEHAPGETGYAREGVGELYTGFAMVAPAYYAKTKKTPVFIPIYASKNLRTLTFGKGIPYDVKAPQTEEKLRVVNLIQQSMLSLYEDEKRELKRRADNRRHRYGRYIRKEDSNDADR